LQKTKKESRTIIQGESEGGPMNSIWSLRPWNRAFLEIRGNCPVWRPLPGGRKNQEWPHWLPSKSV